MLIKRTFFVFMKLCIKFGNFEKSMTKCDKKTYKNSNNVEKKSKSYFF